MIDSARHLIAYSV